MARGYREPGSDRAEAPWDLRPAKDRPAAPRGGADAPRRGPSGRTSAPTIPTGASPAPPVSSRRFCAPRTGGAGSGPDRPTPNFPISDAPRAPGESRSAWRARRPSPDSDARPDAEFPGVNSPRGATASKDAAPSARAGIPRAGCDPGFRLMRAGREIPGRPKVFAPIPVAEPPPGPSRASPD